jgi:glyoxylase-like metal-dependent hydrolase (beta-lactamase superfamily II)
MHVKEIGQNIFIIDLETGGYKNLISSYVLKGEKTVIIETGPTSSISNLLDGIKELGINPEAIAYVAISHVHIDHAGGVGTLLKKLPNAKVIVHSRGAPHLKDPSKLWPASQQTLGEVAEMFGKPEPVSEDKIIVASEGMTFNLGKEMMLRAIEAPGHAAHNLAYYEQLNNGVFPGDSAGAYLPEFKTVFPTTPPPFRPDIALITLEKLWNLNPKFLYYSHFGKAPDGAKRLREYAIQVKMWLSIVQEDLKLGKNPEAIREHIFQEDKSICGIVPALKLNAVHKKTLLENSVRGFIEFAQAAQI